MPKQLGDDEMAELKEIFSHFDRDHSGFIDRKEFGALMNALGATMGPEELAAGIAAVDRNNNGRIEFKEFARWWSER